jgi:hypothetical protein
MWGTNDEGQTNDLTTENLKQRQWRQAWEKAEEGGTRTDNEQAYSRAMEMVKTMNRTQAIWNGVVTKAWEWLLKWADTPESDLPDLLATIREIILKQGEKMWTRRRETEEAAPVPDPPTIPTPRQRTVNKRTPQQRELDEWMTWEVTPAVKTKRRKTTPAIRYKTPALPFKPIRHARNTTQRQRQQQTRPQHTHLPNLPQEEDNPIQGISEDDELTLHTRATHTTPVNLTATLVI